MAIYDSIDIDYSWEGDFSLGVDGDLQDTSRDQLLALENEIRDIVKGEFDDWESQPNITADVLDFKGEPNTRETAEKIRYRVESKLISSGTVAKESLLVRIVPVGLHQVLIAIKVEATPTPNNRLELGEPISINIVYDSSENSIFFLPVNRVERNSLFA